MKKLAKLSLLPALLALSAGCALADITIDLNGGLVGDIYGTSTPGAYTGLTVTGTVTIDPVGGAVTGVNLTAQGDPNVFTGFFCEPGPTCTYFYNSGFSEYGYLDLGNLVGFKSGPLASDSWIYLSTPLGSGSAGVQYYLSGALPEPGLYGTLAIGLGGLLFVAYRRRRIA